MSAFLFYLRNKFFVFRNAPRTKKRALIPAARLPFSAARRGRFSSGFDPTVIMTKLPQASRSRRFCILSLEFLIMGALPLLLAIIVLGVWKWDLAIPLTYSGSDDVWQLVLTKFLRDTGWVLDSPFLGAPDIAHWQYHSAAQTSSLHSILMLGLSWFIDDAVKIQQVYYLLNYSMICLTSYIACRMLGLTRYAAGAVGFLYAFTNFRIGWLFYAFLSNYAAVPLAFVPVFWIMTGVYNQYFPSAEPVGTALRRAMRSSKFWYGICFLMLVTLSDGYYAFFTLMMLGFALFVRAAIGDWRRPAQLLVPLIFIGVVVSLALLMTAPLKSYQRSHMSEFYPDGKEDQQLVKRPFEAEVYSSSLKLLMAPIIEHRIVALANAGKTMIASSDAARKFPVNKPIVSIGTFGQILLVLTLLGLPVLMLRHMDPASARPAASLLRSESLIWSALILSYFIFLCSIAGGVGSLVALIYPTIRAYDRFPLFLMFSLFVGAGAAVTALMRGASRSATMAAFAIAGLFTVVCLYDQIPTSARQGDPATAAKYLAERQFVAGIESSLPRGAMVYQFPHSQYLSNNPYYGWGSFAHVRLYLHSQALRWSNGASKNSAVENWHDKVAGLPLEKLLDEIEGIGFQGMVIDRGVVPPADYDALKVALAARGMTVAEDGPSALSFVRLNNPGYRVEYDRDYAQIDHLVVTDLAALRAAKLPRMVNAPALAALVQQTGGHVPLTIERSGNPTVFVNAAQASQGMGDKQILPLTSMAGSLQCELPAAAPDTVILSIVNTSGFDWQFNSGRLPLKIGLHVKSSAGSMLRWDDGFRVAQLPYVASGAREQVRVPIKLLSRAGIPDNVKDAEFEFAVVQDGHAWFNHLSCRVPLPR